MLLLFLKNNVVNWLGQLPICSEYHCDWEFIEIEDGVPKYTSAWVGREAC